MVSDDEETLFSLPSGSPSPVRRTSLKRLRRASRFPDEPATVSPPLPVPTPPIDELGMEDQVDYVSRSRDGDLEKTAEEVEDDGLDPLFGERDGCDASSVGVSGESDRSDGMEKDICASDRVEEKKKSAKKRLDLDWEEENDGEKMNKMDGEGHGKPVESIPKKRKLEKVLLFPTQSDQTSS